MAITALDKLTVKVLDDKINSYRDMLNDTTNPPSQKTAEILQNRIKKYTAQKGKTVNIYNANKNKKKYKTKLAGISKSVMSVEYLYKKMGVNKLDASGRAGFIQKLGEHPIENALNATGLTLAIGGVMSIQTAKGSVGNLTWEVIKKLFKDVLFKNKAATMLTIGSALLAGTIASKIVRKNREQAAVVDFEAEQNANKGSARDADVMNNAKTGDANAKQKLIDEAVNDPEVMQYLEAYSYDPANGDTMATAAEAVAAAKAKIAENEREAEGRLLGRYLAEEALGKAVPTNTYDKKGNLITTYSTVATKVNAQELLAKESKLKEVEKLAEESAASKTNDTTTSGFDVDKYTTGVEKTAVDNIKAFDGLSGTALTIKLQTFNTVDDFVNGMTSSIADGPDKDAIKTYATAVYNRQKAAHQLSVKSTEYDVTMTGGKVTKLGTDAVTYDSDGRSNIEKDSDEAIIAAAYKAGLLTEADAKEADQSKVAKRLRATYGKEIAHGADLAKSVEAGKSM